MKRLPSAKDLTKRILATPLGKGATLNVSVAYLLAHRTDLAKFADVASMVTDPAFDQSKVLKGCEFHLRTIRAQLARELWGRQLFIGISVLDDLLFRQIAHSTSGDPVRGVLEIIRDKQLHHPGFVIFPVHSFGILGAGLLHWFTESRIEYTSREFGLAITPQTNSWETTLEFLKRVKESFGIKRKIPEELLVHLYRSRSARWLTLNPLLVVKVQSFPGQYYENQFLLLSRLRLVTALLSMFASLQPTADEKGTTLWSSSLFNNFQTLDIDHYIVLYNSPASPAMLSGDCVPMQLNIPALTEISDLGIELDPRFWKRRSAMARTIFAAANAVHAGYLEYSFGPQKDKTRGRVYRKCFESLTYFRRSFRRSDSNWDSVISLAIAFEMILTDSYLPGINARIARRTRLALRGISGNRKHLSAVQALYHARGEVVHQGAVEKAVDMQAARRAFVQVFVAISGRLGRLNPNSAAPIRDILGDPEP